MLLVFDVGNTNMVIGIYKDKSLVKDWRICTDIHKTSDEYGMLIGNLLAHNNIDIKSIDDVIISSVVPNVMHALENFCIKYCEKKPMIVGPGIKTGLNIKYDNPKQVGADRIVNAVAAIEKYGSPLIVVDFGTATTYDLVTEDGRFVGGVTSPGIRTSANALWQQAAKLPEIEIRKPQYILAKDTVTSMQGGLVYGYIGQTEYIIRKMKEESGLGKINVVATGGLGKMIAQETSFINYYDANLTLKGLQIIYDKQKQG